MPEPALILLVDDEQANLELFSAILEDEGYRTLSAKHAALALQLLESNKPDLIISDIYMPEMGGFEFYEKVQGISELRSIPFIFLSALSDRAHVREGKELGADDYLTKPFSPRELVLRVHAMLRRGRSTEAPAGPASYGSGRLVVDDVGHDVCSDGELVRLSPTEWSILETLARTPGRVYSRYELVNSARGYEQEGYERVVDSHVKNLRHKLGDDGREPRIIETVVGVGYRLGLSLDR